jgi:hypothetical protein
MADLIGDIGISSLKSTFIYEALCLRDAMYSGAMHPYRFTNYQ